MLISFIRTVILYSILILVIRLMGKRQLGEMEPMEFVVTMLLANLAAVPMQETGIPLLAGLIPILVVLSMELLLSVLVYHSVHARRLLCGKPVILMENGRLLQDNMKKTRITPDELTEFARMEGITDLSGVKYAILETGGQISILPYAKYKPASAKDAGVKVEDAQLPVTVISDGHVLRENLPKLGKPRAWVDEVLREYQFLYPDKIADGRAKEEMRRIYQVRFQKAMPVYSPVIFPDGCDKKVVDIPATKHYSDEKETNTALTEDEHLVLEKLTDEPQYADVLVAATELPTQRVIAALTLLQIKGLATKSSGNCYQRKSF